VNKGAFLITESCIDLRRIFQEKYNDVFRAAREGEQRCLKAKRWNGNATLIIVDAALDSIGLNYFKVVVPRVRKFYKKYVKTGEINCLEKLSNLTPRDFKLKKIINNERVWEAAINISKELNQIKVKNGLLSDFAALRFWAKKAEYENWKNDVIGKIRGVGLITFQYLRMQVGIDTTMPDKVIKKAIERDFGLKAENDIQFIKEVENLSKKLGYSQILLCWAIWLKQAGVRTSGWEDISRL
jgi:hypothetical protein